MLILSVSISLDQERSETDGFSHTLHRRVQEGGIGFPPQIPVRSYSPIAGRTDPGAMAAWNGCCLGRKLRVHRI